MTATDPQRAASSSAGQGGLREPVKRADGDWRLLDIAIDRCANWLLGQQHPDGYWCGELEGDTILESEFILLQAWLGQEQSPLAGKAVRYLLEQQLPQGGWPLFPGGPLEISASVKAYFALKLTGHDPQSEPLERARAAILAAGGADAVNSFTRFYLALLGQVPYAICPAVPAELVLLPPWFPINIYRISAWSRTILVPLSVVWAHRPVKQLDSRFGIAELFLREPMDWPPLRCPGLPAERGWWSWDRLFRWTDRAFKAADARRWKPLRSRALRAAEPWMLERFEASDGLGAIFPPIVWSIVALKCLGHEDGSPPLLECQRQLGGLVIEEADRARLQPCKSPVWDTALALRALAATGTAPSPALQRGVAWLLNKEVRQPGDWQVRVKAEPSGWFFEHRNAFYPDVDDTIMVMMALPESLDCCRAQGATPAPAGEVRGALERACRWVLAMQNRDGGWAAFDRDNDAEFLCRLPFADHNAMIDPSTADITGRVLESLAQFAITPESRVIHGAVRYLRSAQEPDGSWSGRWGVNYIYGTWQVLTGLAAVKIPLDDPALVRGAEWLLACQQACGGWGESAASYDDPTQRGRGPVTPSQTAWALLGLIAAGWADHPAVRRGLEYLLESQKPDGTWDEAEFTGTGFPRVFYLRYHLYRVYFPLLALARYRQLRKGAPRATGGTRPS